jgi:hypothetical protein
MSVSFLKFSGLNSLTKEGKYNVLTLNTVKGFIFKMLIKRDNI